MTRILGRAELFTRCLDCIHGTGDNPMTVRAHSASYPYFQGGEPDCLHGWVLSDLAVTAAHIDALPEPEAVASLLYPALGFALTPKAAVLADTTQHFEDSGSPWRDALEIGDRTVVHLPDGRDDRQIGAAGLLAVLREVSATAPAGMHALPGHSPQDTPLFVDGYPTTLLGHAAAALHVNAVYASQLVEAGAVDLFRVLGWQLTVRAQAIADTVQRAEAEGASWTEVAMHAAVVSLEHLDAHECDR